MSCNWLYPITNIGKVSIYELPHREEKTKSSRVGGGGEVELKPVSATI